MQLRACPACGAKKGLAILTLTAEAFCANNETYARDFDHILGISRDDVFPIVECRSCRFIYSELVPEFLPLVYAKVTTPTLTRTWIAHQLRLASILVRECEAEHPRILDYGCGDGLVVNVLRSAGLDCDGFDLHRPKYSAAPNGTYDGILLSDVLEHAEDPRGMLRDCRKLGQLLLINVPAFNGPLDPHSREVNPWEHLNYFSARTLRSMVRSEGFEVREVEIDIGLRPNLHGLARLGNLVKSMGRAFAPPASTCILAVRR